MTALSRAEERLIRSLGQRRRREAEGLFLAEGVRVVEELLAAGLVPRLALLSPALEATARGAALAERLRAAADVRAAGDRDLARLSQTQTSQGVLVVAAIPATDLAAVRPATTVRGLVLDGVQDPGNIGTLARSAAAFGFDLLVLLPGTVDAWNPKAVRASAGALFRIAVVETSPDAFWEWLDQHGVTLLGADAAGEPVDRAPAPGRLALAVGNEGAGLGDGTRRRCHRLVAVPMRGPAESLNVAVAGGILLYELTRGAK